MIKRVFLAIDLPKTVKSDLKKYYDSSQLVKWTDPQNLHITLNFLGNIDEMQLASVFELTEKACSAHAPFALSFENIAAHKSMIWAELQSNPDLKSLYENLSLRFQKEHFASFGHKIFRPHVCLARSGIAIENFHDSKIEKPIEFRVSHVVVFESKLRPQGPLYISLDAFELKKFE